MPEDVGLRLTADSAPLWVLALTLGNRGTCLMAKKIRPEGRKNLQQQAQQLAGTSQCGEKFITYEINYKM